jgi:hypothetical protein
MKTQGRYVISPFFRRRRMIFRHHQTCRRQNRLKMILKVC